MKSRRLILAISVVVIVTILVDWQIPLAAKYLTGTARVLQPLPRARIYINDTLRPAIKIFQANENFDGTPGSKILLFDESQSIIPERVITILPGQKSVCFTNSGKKNYQTFSGYLMESESGAKGNVAIDNKAKGAGFDPRLSFTCNAIRFHIVRNKGTQDFKVVY